ncbi:MAG TPA: hypothetical protein ENK58_04650 [Desulfobacterales bacterium]|nr:hypothetical protein [Desulfobacterales bacterium]
MLVVYKQNIADMLLMEAFSEMHQVRDRLNFFYEKYQQDFEVFSKQTEKEDENFEHFDDYMEWKAYIKLFHNILQKIEDLRYGNFQIA